MADLNGQAAPAFRLVDSEGVNRQLSDYEGHWLLLVFLRHLG